MVTWMGKDEGVGRERWGGDVDGMGREREWEFGK